MSDAMKALRTTSFDLVLLDLCVAGDEDGLLGFLDSLELQIPVIFITGSHAEWLVAEAEGRREVAFLQKPVTMSHLAWSIESLYARQALARREV